MTEKKNYINIQKINNKYTKEMEGVKVNHIHNK